MKVASEMQVHVFHRNYLRISAACRATLHSKTRAKGGFAYTYHRIFTNGIQRITKPNSRRCLTFTRRSRVDRRDQNQLSARFPCLRRDEISRDLCLIMTKG